MCNRKCAPQMGMTFHLYESMTCHLYKSDINDFIVAPNHHPAVHGLNLHSQGGCLPTRKWETAWCLETVAGRAGFLLREAFFNKFLIRFWTKEPRISFLLGFNGGVTGEPVAANSFTSISRSLTVTVLLCLRRFGLVANMASLSAPPDTSAFALSSCQ